MIATHLILEDGRRFDGISLGAEGPAIGEVVFNTSMTGYQEILTDPSYTGQLVTMTYPLIGNYGTNDEDAESARPQVAGFIVREASRVPSSWRSRSTLDAYLVRHGVVGIADLDTRALTRHIRTLGAMRGGIAPATMDPQELLERVRAHPRMEGLDLACGVSTDSAYVVRPEGEPRFHVVAFDFGVKANSPRLLVERGCKVTVVPAETDTEAVLAMEPDGLFISNGPGDPAAVQRASETIRTAAERDIPILGICLGHQLIARAYGAETYKLPFGHHGGNHPVRNHDRDTVEITSQNHGFAVRAEGSEVPGAPGFRVTHTNLYDQTVAGIAHKELPIVSVQYHPEAAPGPHDSAYLFDDFVALMEVRNPS
ncbi:MAG: glutamine-hydrolyzing carbamoyl-phosphate synthase small subunit [Gemmatimonadetes bacterium]|nr:glutamine-hydrolyzing carbamoyl-phosphate synthase small subunit [Gemmatimonadota bacterium]